MPYEKFWKSLCKAHGGRERPSRRKGHESSLLSTRLLGDREFYERFLWEPAVALERLPNGDGGFLSLLFACSLIERCMRLDKAKDATEWIRGHFDVPSDVARDFWDVFRNGLAHGGLPAQRGRRSLPAYRMLRNSLVTMQRDEDGTGLVVDAFNVLTIVLTLLEPDDRETLDHVAFPIPHIVERRPSEPLGIAPTASGPTRQAPP